MPAAQTKDRLHGTLDALILKTLSWGPRHGYAISRWLRDSSGDAIQVEEGSLYPALYRMERERWIEAEWGVSELGRKARFYQLTPRGRKQLAAETRRFAEFVEASSYVTTAEQIGNAGGRRVCIDLGILREELMREQSPVGPPRHDVGERAAAVDAELPGAVCCHPSRISPAA